MLRCKAAEVHRDSFAPSHLSTSVASRSGWLAQLVRAPVSHTGGHRFESCAAHFRTRNWEVGTRNIGGEPFGPNELPLLFRVPRSHFRVRLLDASRSCSFPHLPPASAPRKAP